LDVSFAKVAQVRSAANFNKLGLTSSLPLLPEQLRQLTRDSCAIACTSRRGTQLLLMMKT